MMPRTAVSNVSCFVMVVTTNLATALILRKWQDPLVSRTSKRRAERGLPTTYRGVRYRSRLEARWACVLDFLGWPHEYEPCVDEEVRGWLPDFAVEVAGVDYLAECKPALSHPQLEPARRKVELSGWHGPTLLLSARWGVALVRGLDRAWRPAHVVRDLGGGGLRLSVRAEPDPDAAWWVRSGWVDAGNRTQWQR